MKTYSTNLTDSRWKIADDLLKDKRPRKYEIRDIFDGIFYLLKTGCQWRMLPLCFPPWETVYYYFTVWKHKGQHQQPAHYAYQGIILICQYFTTNRYQGFQPLTAVFFYSFDGVGTLSSQYLSGCWNSDSDNIRDDGIPIPSSCSFVGVGTPSSGETPSSHVNSDSPSTLVTATLLCFQ